MSLIASFLAAAEERGPAPAIVAPDGRVITYAALARSSALRAHAYAEAGIGAGDAVLVAAGVSPGFYSSLLGLFRLGAVAVFPEAGAGLAGVRQAIAAAHPKALIAGARVRMLRAAVPDLARLPLLPDRPRAPLRGDGCLARAAPNAPALITFTSGSTGRPRGIVRSAEALLLQHQLLERVRRTNPDDVDLISLPVFILSNLAAGAASVIPAGDLRKPARLDGARLRRQMAASKVNRVVAPPALCARLAQAPMPNLTTIFTGGGPVFPNLWRELRTAAPKARICAVYGSTEAEPIAHIDMDEIADEDWDAMASGDGLLAGYPIPEIAINFADREIEVSGPHVNRGYLDRGDDAATKVARDGQLWHRTGDCGRLDAKGRLWLLGRRAAAARNLYPFVIETAALSWPGVRQAALVAEADGARLAIAGSRLDEAELRERARALGVSNLIVLQELPTDRRHNSKIDYARLRARIGPAAKKAGAPLGRSP